MALNDPFKVYVAASNIEAHLIVEALGNIGIEAFVEEDVSGASLFAFGTLSQFHQPNVWIDKCDVDRAVELIQDFEARQKERHADKVESTPEPEPPQESVPVFDLLSADHLLYGVTLIDDGYEYYSDWCAMMLREFDDAIEPALEHGHAVAVNIAENPRDQWDRLIAESLEAD